MNLAREIHMWKELEYLVEFTKAKNVTVRLPDTLVFGGLLGNDGTVLTLNPKIAEGYILTDWDAVNCCATRATLAV